SEQWWSHELGGGGHAPIIHGCDASQDGLLIAPAVVASAWRSEPALFSLPDVTPHMRWGVRCNASLGPFGVPLHFRDCWRREVCRGIQADMRSQDRLRLGTNRHGA